VSIPGPDIGSDLTLPPIVVPAPDRPPGPDPFLVPTPQLSQHDTHKVCVGVDPCTPCLVPSTLKPVIPSRRAEGMHPGGSPDPDGCRYHHRHIWFGGPGGFTGRGLQNTLSSILAWTAPPTHRPAFVFKWSALAAKTNWEILQSFDRDLHRALSAQPFSTLSIGSEFRPASVLAPLCCLHPLWSRAST
jgi:hypothetical protein